MKDLKKRICKDISLADREDLPVSMRRRMREDGLEPPEATVGVLRDIFCRGDLSKPYTGRLEDICAGNGSGASGGPAVNTYPFGVPSGLFPEFLGVCCGGRRLTDVLDRAVKQCEKMAAAFGPGEPKWVTILTDKWDGPLFKRKYEELFLRFALGTNVLFVFWLVTDYGVTRVPFLAENRDGLDDLRHRYPVPAVPPGSRRGREIAYGGGDGAVAVADMPSAVDDEVWEAVCKLEDGCCSIRFPGGGRYRYDSYVFQFHSLFCRCFRSGRAELLSIPREAAERFALAVRDLSGQPGRNITVGQAPAGGPAGWVVSLFDREFTSLDGGTGGDPEMETVRGAFDRLIASLPCGVDLHTHSTASDGLYSPLMLARRALDAGVTTLALTDHDTVEGVRELMRTAPWGLTVIPGVEVSARTASGKCHILGLGCNLDHPEFVKLMDQAAALRRNKLEARLAFIKERGFEIPEEELDALRALPSVGKPRIADVLVKYGYAPDTGAAIRNVIDKCPPVQDRVDAALAISAIHASGGVSVWAHPYGETGKPALTPEEFRAMLADLLAAGIRGMECWYSKYTPDQCRALETLAGQLGLLVSGGSDCHGRPGTAPIGRLNASGRRVPAEKLTILSELQY